MHPGLGGQDRPPLLLEDRADLDAVGKRRVRDVIEALPAHQEEVADGLEAGLCEQRALADLTVLRERRQLDAHERILAGRADPGARQVPTEQRSPEEDVSVTFDAPARP